MGGREGSAKRWKDEPRWRARKKLGIPIFGMVCGEVREMGETTCE
jgi:hypothetical protein